LAWYKNLKLRGKLLLSFMAVFAIGALVNLVMFDSQKNVNSTVNVLLDDYVQQSELSLQTVEAMLNARNLEREYLLANTSLGFDVARETLVDPLADQVGIVRTNLRSLMDSSQGDEIDKLSAADQAVSSYLEEFLATVKLIETKGFRNDGLEGEFRQKVHTIEEAITAESLDRLAVDMLTIRRHEKDYLMRGDQRYVANIAATIEKLKNDTAASGLTADKQANINQLADEYQSLFSQVVDIDTDIAAGKARWQQVVSGVLPLLNDIHDQAVADQIQARQTMDSQVAAASSTAATLSMVAALLAVGIAWLMASLLSRAINRLARVAQQISVGNIDHEIKAGSKDEIGTMATSFAAMINYMKAMADAADKLSHGDIRVRVEPASDKDVLGTAFANMIHYRQKISSAAERMAVGDVSVSVQPHSPQDSLGNSFKRMIDYQQRMARVAGNMAEGRLGDSIELQSDEDILGDSFNRMIRYQRQMAAAASALADGNLTVSVSAQSQDDVLGQAFSRMLVTLRELISQVQHSAGVVAAASERLTGTASSANTDIKSIAAAIQAIAEGSHQQADSFKQTSSKVAGMVNVSGGILEGANKQDADVGQAFSLIDSMAASVEQVNTAAGSVNDANSKVKRAAQSGVNTISETSEKIDVVKQRMNEAVHRVEEMNDRSREISTIIETISTIADTTNMLSLNAAIEAAQAGEHGKGFAVLARQVRDLSVNTKEASDGIAELINAVQESVKDVIVAMENTASEVSESVALTSDTETALKQILNEADTAANLSSQIDSAMTNLSSKTKGVLTAVSDVQEVVTEHKQAAMSLVNDNKQISSTILEASRVAGDNETATDQVNNSARDMTQQMDTVSEAVTELSNMAAQLMATSNSFSLRGDEPAIADIPKLTVVSG